MRIWSPGSHIHSVLDGGMWFCPPAGSMQWWWISTTSPTLGSLPKRSDNLRLKNTKRQSRWRTPFLPKKEASLWQSNLESNAPSPLPNAVGHINQPWYHMGVGGVTTQGCEHQEMGTFQGHRGDLIGSSGRMPKFICVNVLEEYQHSVQLVSSLEWSCGHCCCCWEEEGLSWGPWISGRHVARNSAPLQPH